MSAISVAFTIYADNLPGEVYEDSSVFRTGKDAAPEMSRKILAALGQLMSVNSSIFNRMRTTGEGLRLRPRGLDAKITGSSAAGRSLAPVQI